MGLKRALGVRRDPGFRPVPCYAGPEAPAAHLRSSNRRAIARRPKAKLYSVLSENVADVGLTLFEIFGGRFKGYIVNITGIKGMFVQLKRPKII